MLHAMKLHLKMITLIITCFLSYQSIRLSISADEAIISENSKYKSVKQKILDDVCTKINYKNLFCIYPSSESFFEALPNEDVSIITTYLDPISILRLSHVSRRFREFLDNDFWMRYNLSQNYQTFTEERSYYLIFSFKVEALPIKVMISNYYYEIGIDTHNENLIKKSATLGLSKSQKYLEEKQSSSTPYRFGSSEASTYSYFCRKCGMPRHRCRH